MNGFKFAAALTAVFIAVPLAYAQTEVPHEFQAGQPARAAEVNENFQALEQAVQDLELSSSNVRTQVLSGLDLASAARWLVTDFYLRHGRWPVDNQEAGVEFPTNITNKFVERLDVAPPGAGVFSITFGQDSNVAIHGSRFIFAFTDNVGAIERACSWDSELDAYVTEQDCAFVDESPPHLTTIRKQVALAIDLASEARWLVADYYGHLGTFPESNAEAGAAEATTITNSVVASVEISTGGEIRATFGSGAHTQIDADWITFRPVVNGGGITWFCESRGLYPRYIISNGPISACILKTDRPPLPLTVLRGQIESGFPMAATIRSAVDSYFIANSVWPTSNADVGLPGPTTYINASIESVGVTPDGTGTVRITYGPDAHPTLIFKTVSFTPTNNGGSISWLCESIDIENRFMPFGCKN